jgi:hypothetical protein
LWIADIKRFFLPLASRTVSNSPSTHESDGNENVMEHQEEDPEVEEWIRSMVADTEQVEDSVEATMAENVEVLGAEGITDFIDYIKPDPSLRIPLDRFAPNVRDDVRFAYLKNGPTQPTDHNFPPNKDN